MKKNAFVCFGGNDWWYHNRNHFDTQMSRYFAKHGNALYINSIVMQKVNVSQGTKFAKKLIRKVKSICRGLKKSGVGFWVYSPFSLPVHHIAWLRPLNRMIVQFQVWLVCRILHIRNPVVLAACPAACEMAINMEKSRLVYQRTDRFEEYPNVDAETIRRYDRKLKATADLTVFVSSSLYEEERKQCKKALFVDQGVNYDMFASAEKNEDIPREMLKVERPIVGFFGGIDDHTSDIRFVEKVIELLPQMSFVFVGQASLDVTGLQKKNVWMLGQKPYEEIPHYGKCFDVAIMVWRQNHWIQACNPIKLKEYLALGKPIVSTPFPELDKYLDVVYKAETPEQFAESIESALAEDSPGRIMARREKVRGASWKKTAQLVRKELFENEQTEQDIGKSE